MADKENNDEFIAFVQFKGLRGHTGQIGWVQMQVSGSGSFADLLGSTLAESEMVLVKGWLM
jgi:hypothetical protein